MFRGWRSPDPVYPLLSR
ncbi:hypothetical protein PUB92_14670 [Aeromonas dhakensis]|nr:hypothetical protein [Aeromonas dhakensis]WDF96929.1 hypothetical protein PUB92_14670 [Aeromonas dhakensis]